MLELIFLICVVLVFVRLDALSKRIDKIERGGYQQSVAPQAAVTKPVEVAKAAPSATTQLVRSQTLPTAPKHEVTGDDIVNWFKEDWLLKLGAFLLILGFGWFATYAFMNNWIGPAGRISLGIGVGILIMVFGWFRIKKYLHQGSIFLVLGSTVVLLTTYAAREYYGFLTPLTALAMMFLSTVFVAYVSVREKSSALALSSLILAGIAPLLTNTPQPDYVGLFSYLLVVLLGTIWVVVLSGKRELIFAGFVLLAAYSLPHLNNSPAENPQYLLLFEYAFAALFFVFNLISMLKLKESKELVPDLLTACGNGLLLLAWIIQVGEKEWQSLTICAWMALFLGAAFLVFQVTKKREPFYVYFGVGISMLASATAIELKGSGLAIAYIIESGIISIVLDFVLQDSSVSEGASLLLIGPGLLSFGSLAAYVEQSALFNKDFFVILTLAAVLFGLGFYYLYTTKQKPNIDIRRHYSLIDFGSAYVYLLVWFMLDKVFNDYVAILASLLIYTLVGLATYIFGINRARKGFAWYGGTLLGLVVLRLLIVDVWNMEMVGKIVTFFLIGTLLISTAFVGKKSMTKSTV